MGVNGNLDFEALKAHPSIISNPHGSRGLLIKANEVKQCIL